MPMIDTQPTDNAPPAPAAPSMAEPARGVTRPPPVLWRHRDLIAQLARREVTQRFRGAVLGVAWSLINPLINLAIYTFVFCILFNAQWSEPGYDDSLAASKSFFALMLFAGLIPFTVFSEVATRAPTLILSVPNYVKKVVFPLEVLPVVVVISAIVQSLLSMCILLIGSLIFMRAVTPAVLLLPLAYLPLALGCVGLCYFLASVGMYVRDMAQAIGPVVSILSFLTPIFYPPSKLAGHQWLFYINPLTMVVQVFRRTALPGPGFPWLGWSIITVVSIVMSIGGYAWFMKTKNGFADVL
jgi:lipopolysaccharide transport system permease protein